MALKLIVILLLYGTTVSYAQESPHTPTTFVTRLPYDVVYVRYPNSNSDSPFVTISQGEKAYEIAPSADLILLKSDGKEVVLVDCDTCSVVDPVISFDGKTVYYSKMLNLAPSSSQNSNIKAEGFLYKIHLDDPNYREIRLTFDDGFDSDLYAGNTASIDNQASMRGVRDMAPVPLADGRLLFTSNRAATTALREHTNGGIKSSIQHLYVMTDHEGELNTKELSGIRPLDMGAMSMVQHPMQLKDGRILFSTWQPFGHKFLYAMTSLFTIHPDGTNLMQFTEPHDRSKFLDHFITQLPNEDVVWGHYYPSFDYGYGVLLKSPINPIGPDWMKGSMVGGKRGFDRKGTVNMTPHTTAGDKPAPNRSGKYAMPSVASNDSLLVAYSKGYVNYFDASCNKTGKVNKKGILNTPRVNIKDGVIADNYPFFCEALRSGIYMITNVSTNIVSSPSELLLIKDDPLYNEIWPRAVLSYQELYGQERPNVIPFDRSNTDGITAITGTASMINRESNTRTDVKSFRESDGREFVEGNWTVQGTDVHGIYNDEEIYAVRIVGTPQKPFTENLTRKHEIFDTVSGLLEDERNFKNGRLVARYTSFHEERWEVLGEFKLPHTDKTDVTGKPDTSWAAIVPADTPHFLQALDENGMMLNSESTWRALQPGEKRVDCGGCHAHSIESLDYAKTSSGRRFPIKDIAGVQNNDPRIKNGIWNLTTGSIPVLTKNGTEFINQRVLGAEFTSTVMPVLKRNCASCHGKEGEPPLLVGDSFSVYKTLTDKRNTDKTVNNGGKTFRLPQISRYIRSPQARASMLVWIFYNQRLDGLSNFDDSTDINFPEMHPFLNVTDEDKRAIARWVDMGGPIDFPTNDGFEYSKDSSLPIVREVFLSSRPLKYANHLSVGVYDANSGLNKDSLQVSYYKVINSGVINEVTIPIDQSEKLDLNSVIHIDLEQVKLPRGSKFVVRVSIHDLAGNKNVFTKLLTK